MGINSVICSWILLLSVVSCGKKGDKGHMPTPRITVEKAYIKEVPTRMVFAGITSSFNDVHIQPRVGGYLLSVHYRSGMPVKRGQLLFKLESQTNQDQLVKAKSLLATAKSQLLEAQNNYNRSAPLARINAISQSTLDQAILKLSSTKATLLSAEASLNSAKLNLSYTTIYSPIDGVIGETVGSVGDYVGVGSEIPVLNTISNIDSIYVGLSISVDKYFEVMERDSLTRALYDNSDLLTDIEMILSDGILYKYKGVYDFTERAVNSETGSVVVQVLFPNHENYLKPGQYVRVQANVGSGVGAILIPQRAVTQSQNVNSVYVVGKDSMVVYRAVQLGRTYGSQWEVLEGIEPDELVLTEGLQKVRNGMKIIPVIEAIATTDTTDIANFKSE